jgi:hypothetical protein
MPHWQLSGIAGVRSMISTSGLRSSSRKAMNMRGMIGKWKAMWNSSPAPK